MMPAISLVIPAFNREKFVTAAVGSVLRQTERDFELVVWDDGSSDDTVAAAKQAAGADPRVRVIAAEHSGITRSMNAAAKLLSGKYFGWVDSDDGIAPTALADARALLDAKTAVGIVYTDYLIIDEDGTVTGPGTRTKIPYSKDRLLIDFMTFHFRLMRRELFDSLGGLDPAAEPAEDYDFCLRLSEVAEFEHLPKPLYLYRVHSGSISSQKRLEQIDAAKQAIGRALQRRGMAQDFDVDVELVGRFRIVRRKKADR